MKSCNIHSLSHNSCCCWGTSLKKDKTKLDTISETSARFLLLNYKDVFKLVHSIQVLSGSSRSALYYGKVYGKQQNRPLFYHFYSSKVSHLTNRS